MNRLCGYSPPHVQRMSPEASTAQFMQTLLLGTGSVNINGKGSWQGSKTAGRALPNRCSPNTRDMSSTPTTAQFEMIGMSIYRPS
ncbi:hypothetical protein BDW22DRAFT_154872 [Trametopsis cervina]|nr:hypothetical protein BDW22DRAFT_154872 [Trametopsis cervina]